MPNAADKLKHTLDLKVPYISTLFLQITYTHNLDSGAQDDIQLLF